MPLPVLQLIWPQLFLFLGACDSGVTHRWDINRLPKEALLLTQLEDLARLVTYLLALYALVLELRHGMPWHVHLLGL